MAAWKAKGDKLNKGQLAKLREALDIIDAWAEDEYYFAEEDDELEELEADYTYRMARHAVVALDEFIGSYKG